MNAFDLLMLDHQKVSGIFDRLEMNDGGVAGSREQLFRQLKNELDVHAHVEETIFYPALKGRMARRRGLSRIPAGRKGLSRRIAV